MSSVNIENIQSNLNIINIQKQHIDNRRSIHVEVTVTNSCNCHCKYCFESNHQSIRDIEEENRQLKLLKRLCQDFDCTKYRYLQISFWGGEPMLNIDFIKKIINETYNYQFVEYFMYTNGTLYDEFIKLFQDPIVRNIRKRFSIQISYDGEPHQKMMRCYDSQPVFKTVDFLNDNKYTFVFKATLSFEMIKYLPQIWDSYEQLFYKYKDHVSYSPTLDTNIKNISNEYYNDWKKVLPIIFRKEFYFYKKYNRYLFSWLRENDKCLTCSLSNKCILNNDGNIYVCHGCPYSLNKNDFILGKTNQISSLTDIMIHEEQNYQKTKCKMCGAVICNNCHIVEVDSKNYKNNWIECIGSNKDRCEFFKYFGLIKKLYDFLNIEKINLR